MSSVKLAKSPRAVVLTASYVAMWTLLLPLAVAIAREANAQPPRGFRRRVVNDEAPNNAFHRGTEDVSGVGAGVAGGRAEAMISAANQPFDQHDASAVKIPPPTIQSRATSPPYSSRAPTIRGPVAEPIAPPMAESDGLTSVTQGQVTHYRPSQPPPAEVLPIDLITAWRLAARQNPTIGLAQQVVQENLASLLQARSIVLPGLNAGGNYHYHNGNLQRSSGVILDTPNEQSLYVGGGARTLAAESVAIPAVRFYVPVADAWFNPLAARQEVSVSQFEARATSNTILLDVSLRYLDLVAAESIFDALRRSEFDMADVLRPTVAFAQAGQGLESDANRARSDALLLRSRVQAAEGEIATASARLSQLLQLNPSIALYSPRRQLALVTVVDRGTPLEQLVDSALRYRPEMTARSSEVAAMQVRVRQEEWRPFLPTIAAGASGGAFGGGSGLVTPTFGNFGARSDFDVLAFWTFQNAGVGNASLRNQRSAQMGEAVADRTLMANQVRDEVAAAYADSEAALNQVTVAERRLAAADTGFKQEVRRARNNQGHPIESLNMVHLLIDARVDLIRSVIAYNAAQFRLFVALGMPPPRAIPVLPPQPVSNTGLAPVPPNAQPNARR